jgi:hypothetical protein
MRTYVLGLLQDAPNRYQAQNQKTTEKIRSKVFVRCADKNTGEVPVMDIVIGRTAVVDKDASKENAPQYHGGKRRMAERRKNSQDRRKSVRDGVIVRLSGKDDRRVLRDRRKKSL